MLECKNCHYITPHVEEGWSFVIKAFLCPDCTKDYNNSLNSISFFDEWFENNERKTTVEYIKSPGYYGNKRFYDKPVYKQKYGIITDKRIMSL